jgi:hypothetical protein
VADVQDPNPIKILEERIEAYEEIQLYLGRDVMRMPKGLRTSDEKLRDLLVAKHHIKQLMDNIRADAEAIQR